MGIRAALAAGAFIVLSAVGAGAARAAVPRTGICAVDSTVAAQMHPGTYHVAPAGCPQ